MVNIIVHDILFQDRLYLAPPFSFLQIVEYDVVNKGNQDASYFLVPVHASKSKNLALVEGVFISDSKNLIVSQVSLDDKSASFIPENTKIFRVDLLTPLSPQASTRIRVTTSFTHTLTPFPASIAQSDSQLIMYHDFTSVYALHPVSSQSTIIKLFPGKLESYIPTKHSSRSSNSIIYGPFEYTMAPLTTGEAVAIHYENNFPFATMKTASREFQISHWGQVTVMENYELAHTGAKLKGEFIRANYESHIPAARGLASFEHLSMVLPLSATDIFFRDAIGNVSTSHVRKEPRNKRTHVDIIPRFPLFGGWSADLEIGYGLPVEDTLTQVPNTDDLVLEVPFGLPFDSVAADELAVRVVLPEGAENIRYQLPFEVDQVVMDSMMTYLDTTGRPVLEFKKVNVVAGHWQPFRVAYTFKRVHLLREPGLIIGALFGFFALVMVYARVDLSLGSNGAEEEEDVKSVNGDKVVEKKQEKEEKEVAKSENAPAQGKKGDKKKK